MSGRSTARERSLTRFGRRCGLGCQVIGKKIASGKFPASYGRIGTETLKTIRTAPPKIRERLIKDPDLARGR